MSVLDEMTKGLSTRKGNAASVLTPVGVERPLATIPERVAAPFPNDMPRQVIEGGVREIRRQMKLIEEALAAIDEQLDVAPEPPVIVDSITAQKTVEREADAKFAAEYADKQAKAQAEAFTAEPGSAWRCPKHKREFIRAAVSRTGREYDICDGDDCNEFEK